MEKNKVEIPREPPVMSSRELNLLLYLETCAVDYGGGVSAEHMNEEDFNIAKRWNEQGYIGFGRIWASDITSQSARRSTNWVVLSEQAWIDAHSERRARNERMWAKRSWHKTSEL